MGILLFCCSYPRISHLVLSTAPLLLNPFSQAHTDPGIELAINVTKFINQPGYCPTEQFWVANWALKQNCWLNRLNKSPLQYNSRQQPDRLNAMNIPVKRLIGSSWGDKEIHTLLKGMWKWTNYPIWSLDH